MATIVEILKAAEDNIASIKAHAGNVYLRNFMVAAVFPEMKLNLPETDPPYKVNAMEEAQVPPGIFWQFANKIAMFQQQHKDKMTILRMENAFIQALETVSAKEAEAILACKNQTLHKLYKGLTLANLRKAGYFPS